MLIHQFRRIPRSRFSVGLTEAESKEFAGHQFQLTGVFGPTAIRRGPWWSGATSMPWPVFDRRYLRRFDRRSHLQAEA